MADDTYNLEVHLTPVFKELDKAIKDTSNDLKVLAKQVQKEFNNIDFMSAFKDQPTAINSLDFLTTNIKRIGIEAEKAAQKVTDLTERRATPGISNTEKGHLKRQLQAAEENQIRITELYRKTAGYIGQILSDMSKESTTIFGRDAKKATQIINNLRSEFSSYMHLASQYSVKMGKGTKSGSPVFAIYEKDKDSKLKRLPGIYKSIADAKEQMAELQKGVERSRPAFSNLVEDLVALSDLGIAQRLRAQTQEIARLAQAKEKADEQSAKAKARADKERTKYAKPVERATKKALRQDLAQAFKDEQEYIKGVRRDRDLSQESKDEAFRHSRINISQRRLKVLDSFIEQAKQPRPGGEGSLWDSFSDNFRDVLENKLQTEIERLDKELANYAAGSYKNIVSAEEKAKKKAEQDTKFKSDKDFAAEIRKAKRTPIEETQQRISSDAFKSSSLEDREKFLNEKDQKIKENVLQNLTKLRETKKDSATPEQLAKLDAEIDKARSDYYSTQNAQAKNALSEEKRNIAKAKAEAAKKRSEYKDSLKTELASSIIKPFKEAQGKPEGALTSDNIKQRNVELAKQQVENIEGLIKDWKSRTGDQTVKNKELDAAFTQLEKAQRRLVAAQKAQLQGSKGGSGGPDKEWFYQKMHQAIWGPIADSPGKKNPNLAREQLTKLEEIKAADGSRLDGPMNRSLEVAINKRKQILAGGGAGKGGSDESTEDGLQKLLTFFSYSQLISAADHLARSMMSAAAAMEQYERRVNIVIHDKKAAKDYFNFLKNYEKETPYDIREVMTVGTAFSAQRKTLIQAGLGMESAVRLAGELGSLNPESGVGIIAAQRALSRVAAGDPNGLEILRSQFAITNETLRLHGAGRALTSTGVNLRSPQNRQLIIDAISKYVEEQTQGEGTLGQSKTLAGRVSTLQSQAVSTASALFAPLQGVFVSLVKVLTSLLKLLEETSPIIRGVVAALTSFTLATSVAAQALMGFRWLKKGWNELADTVLKEGAQKGISSAAKEVAKDGLSEGVKDTALVGAGAAGRGGIKATISRFLKTLGRVGANLLKWSFAIVKNPIFLTIAGVTAALHTAHKRAQAAQEKAYLKNITDTLDNRKIGERTIKGKNDFSDLTPAQRELMEKAGINTKNEDKIKEYIRQETARDRLNYASGEVRSGLYGDRVDVAMRTALLSGNWKPVDELKGQVGKDLGIAQLEFEEFKLKFKDKLQSPQDLDPIEYKNLKKEIRDREGVIGHLQSYMERLSGNNLIGGLDAIQPELDAQKLKNQVTLGREDLGSELIIAQNQLMLDKENYELKKRQGKLLPGDELTLNKLIAEIQRLTAAMYAHNDALRDATFSKQSATRQITKTEEIDFAISQASREKDVAKKLAKEAEVIQKRKQLEDDLNKFRIERLQMVEGETVASLARLNREEQQAIRPFEDNAALKRQIHEKFERDRYTLTDNNLRKLEQLEREHVLNMNALAEAQLGRDRKILEHRKAMLLMNQSSMTDAEKNKALNASFQLDKEGFVLDQEGLELAIERINTETEGKIRALEQALDPKRSDSLREFDPKVFEALYKAQREGIIERYNTQIEKFSGSAEAGQGKQREDLISKRNKALDELYTNYSKGRSREDMAALGQLEPEKIRQLIEDAKKDRVSKIRDAKLEVKLNKERVETENKVKSKENKIATDKQQFNNATAMLELEKDRINLMLEGNPQMSTQLKEEALRKQFEIEKSILTLRMQSELADPNIANDETKKLLIQKKYINDIITLQNTYTQKLKEQTGELERQQKLREMEKDYYNQDAKKFGFNAGFSMGEMFGIEDLNANMGMDSEYFRLKAGFGLGGEKKQGPYPGYGPKPYAGYGKSQFNFASGIASGNIDPRTIENLNPFSSISAKETIMRATGGGKLLGDSKWIGDSLAPGKVSEMQGSINIVVTIEDPNKNVLGTSNKRFSSRDIYDPKGDH